MLQLHGPESITSELIDTLTEDQAALFSEECEAGRRARRQPGGDFLSEPFRRWLCARARYFQRRHEAMARAWARFAERLGRR